MKVKKPNILFFFSDQHRGDWMPYDEDIKQRMGVSELDLRMPNIRGMIECGTTFTNAYSPAPVCAPARACLASGRNYRSCRVFQNNINYDTRLPSFYGSLRNSGYHVAGLGKFDLNKGELTWGDGYHETLQKMGFTEAGDCEGKMDAVWAALTGEPGPYGRVLRQEGYLEAYMEDMIHRGHGTNPTPVPQELYADNLIGTRAASMIRNMSRSAPWFLQVNFSGPHDPWDVTEQMKESVRNRTFPEAADCTITRQNNAVRRNYASMIENIDRLIGICLKALCETDQRENTIIVYSADHGEMMGDHDQYGKSRPEQGSIHIPMVIDTSCFGSRGHQYYDSPVELQDLAATFLDYGEAPHEARMESCSLRPAVEGTRKEIRRYAVSELITKNAKGPFDAFSAITDGKWKLIMQNRKEDRLYDISKDPFELKNIAGQHPEIAAQLRGEFSSRGQTVNPVIEEYKASFHLNKE